MSKDTSQQRSSRTRTLIREVDRLTVLISVLLILFLVGLFFFFGSKSYDPQSEPNLFLLRSLTMGVATSMIPVFVLFTGSYIALRKIQEIKSREDQQDFAEAVSDSVGERLAVQLGTTAIYQHFNEIPWEVLIREATEIHIVVHYFDTWIHTWSNSLKQFLERGGKITFFLPNPNNGDLVGHITSRFPEYNQEQVKSKITTTFKKLSLLKEKVRHPEAVVTANYVDVMLWYCGMRFNKRVLILSPFEHNREVSVSAPATYIPLDHYESIKQWFEDEVTRLEDLAVEKVSA